MSATFSFTGNTTILTSEFYPELEFDSKSSYSCALLEFTAYHSIPNVTDSNNRLYFALDSNKDKSKIELIETLITGSDVSKNVYKSLHKTNNDNCYCIQIPTGTYELEELISYLIAKTKKIGISLQLSFNESTLTCKVKCPVKLLLDWSDSIHRLLGFSDIQLAPNTEHVSDQVIKISTLNTISIECDIVSGSYTNGIRGHSLYEFAPAVKAGYKIIEIPKHIIYLPVNRRVIPSIQVRIVDQDGRPIDFRGEKITCRIHIKKD